MKRVFCSVLIFVSLFALASCNKKKEAPGNNETPLFEEEVKKEISAEEGGTIKSSDGSVSIEVSAGALDSDTTITMRIYEAAAFPAGEDEQIVSKVVEFEPSGLIFKEPVIISMNTVTAFENKILTAAVFKESEKKWSYSEHGAYVVLTGRDEGGDPIMTSAAGDPIMLSAAGDPIMMSAGGDPIMFSSAGDPIMLAAAGDPIMTNAAGDPIMNSAAGDPIMMTTGHFTAFTFIALEPKEPMEEPDGNNGEISDKDIIDDPVIKDDDDNDTDISEDDDTVNDEDEIHDGTADEDETPDVDEDTYVAECGNGIVDPGEGCDNGTDNGRTACAYGETSCTLCTTGCQIAEGATSYCGDGVVDTENGEKCDKAVPGSNCSDDCRKMYSKVLCTGMAICTDGKGNQILCPKENEDFYGQDAQYVARKGCVKHRDYTEIDKPEGIEEPPFVKDNVTGLIWWAIDRSGTLEEMKNECSVSFAGIDNWRVPTPQEVLTLADLGQLHGNPVDPFFWAIYYNYYDSILTSSEDYIYLPSSGMFPSNVVPDRAYLYCVSGEEYGKVDESSYKTFTKNGDTAVFDSSTNLVWKKDSVIKTSWKEALEYCENLEYAGFDDWRLPNRNEFISLVDYSKTEADAEAISSFPGMTADVFWTSTPAPLDAYGWVFNMLSGELLRYGYTKRDGIAEEEEEGDPTARALCVRSDLDEKPEIPECDETGVGPCRDASGTIWSSALYSEIFTGYPHFFSGGYVNGIAEMCRYLNENGSNKWRLPTINEIRNIVTTEHLKTDGTCGVTDSCYQESCYNDNSCAYEGWSRTLLYDSGIIVSGTLPDPFDYKQEVWAVNLADGKMEKNSEFSESAIIQRCVLDESLNYEKTPYSDENGLLWSDISPDWMYLQDALYYCDELSKKDSEHWWRLPTVEELWTLVQNGECGEEYDCPADLSGKYSIFGDISTLLSGEYEGDKSYYYIEFAELFFSSGKEGLDRVRCVSDSPSPCKNNPCADVEHSTGCLPLSASEYKCGCDVNYTLNDSVCEPDTHEGVLCEGLPANAEWNSVSSINQTWNGEEWLPSRSGVYNETESTEECRFKCKEGSEWNGSTCLIVAFPYTDPETMLTWSARVSGSRNWSGALSYCESLEEGGYTDWRLPTIDELRTIIINCPGTQAGGACAISDPDHLSESDRVVADCSCNSVSGNSSYYSKLGNDTQLWSSSDFAEGNNYAWRVYFNTANVNSNDKVSNYYPVRCVRSATQQANCTGLPENAEWNSVSSITQTWSGEEWLPSKSGVYNETESTEECRFKCKAHYTWKDSECEPDTQENVQCEGLPENAHWTSASVVSLQTWSGEGWLPSATAFWSEETTSEPCSFKCDDTFFWNNSACVTPLPLGKICTGQNKCYQNTGSGTVACPVEKDDDFYGQDWYYASLGKCAPHSFTIRTISGDNVVYDNNTGIQWQWQESTPEGDFDWDAADAYCKQPYAGYNDWRLPTPMEVFSIGDGSRYQPAVDRTYFPSTNNHDSNNSRYWWTSKKSKAEPTKAYYVQYYVSTESHVKEMTESERLTAICVRGDGMPASSLSTSTLNGNVVVTDSTNGLMWQKTVSGDTFFWQDALDHCKNLTYAGYSDWRLPNKNELQTLLNHDKTGAPYSDFPDISTTKAYWTSTTWASSPNIAWVVDFGKARVFTMLKTNENYTYYAICVR